MESLYSMATSKQYFSCQFVIPGLSYDIETGLYYLQSRYYNPELGRFINADGYTSTGQGVLGNNMFVYCGNNAIINTDFSGDKYYHALALTDGGISSAIPSSTGVDSSGSFSAGSSGSLGKKIKKRITNDNEAEVLDNDLIDFYKGVPVIKVPFMEDNAFSFGVILMGTGVSDESTVRHEYGHCVHLSQIGVRNYASKVAIPSVVSFWSGTTYDSYYSQPWEYIADELGNVNRSGYQYSNHAAKNAQFYWLFTALP